MKKLCCDILTCSDNRTFDNGRVICILSYLMYFILAVLSYATNHPWGAMDFSAGATAMAVGFGINLRLKYKTEPNPE